MVYSINRLLIIMTHHFNGFILAAYARTEWSILNKIGFRIDREFWLKRCELNFITLQSFRCATVLNCSQYWCITLTASYFQRNTILSPSVMDTRYVICWTLNPYCLAIYCYTTILKLLTTLIHFSIGFIFWRRCLSDDWVIAGDTQFNYPVILQVISPL